MALDERNRVLSADCLSDVGVPHLFDVNDVRSRASDAWFIDNRGEHQQGRCQP